MEDLPEAILKVRDRLISEGIASSYKKINEGPCVLFSKEVKGLFKGKLELLNTDSFLGKAKWTSDGDIYWKESVLKKYNLSLPRKNMCNELAKKVHGYHQWIYFKGKHYDAECPYGVKTMFELPFFSRFFRRKSS